MSIASTRAQAVAEILWELKTAQKIATLSSIAERAGFSPGTNGRTIITCLKKVRTEWPHLQWWRAVADNGQVDQEQAQHLVEGGYETETAPEETIVVKSLAEQCMTWEVAEEAE